MSDRVSKAVLLCEDPEHQRLMLAFLKKCGVPNPGRMLRPIVASKMREGGNVGWVIERFPDQFRAVRQRQRSRANSLLIVMIDADECSVEERKRELNRRAEEAGLDPIKPDDPLALIIPKRHIETWIRSLLGDSVTEDVDCKTNKTISKEQLRIAADQLYEWSRPNAIAGPNCVPSLTRALADWRRIGSLLSD